MGNSVIYRPAYDAEVEYLESTGTQWIDTGIVPTENTRVVAKLYTEQNANKNWFGSERFIDEKDRHSGYAFNQMNGHVEYLFGGSGWKVVSASYSLLNRAFEIDYSNVALKVDDATLATSLCSNFPTQTQSMLIFWRQGASESGRIAGRVYNLKIYQNSTLVRDFIPVRIGQVGYMYDKVTKQLFANKGTGNFVLGNDVSNAVIPQQRCVLYFGSQRSVVYEKIYEEYEWLRGRNGAYIDTNYYSTTYIDSFKGKCRYDGTLRNPDGREQDVFGVKDSDNNTLGAYIATSNKFAAYYHKTINDIWLHCSTGNEHEFSIYANGDTFYCIDNGILYQRTTNGLPEKTFDYSIYLFARNPSPTLYFHGDIAYFKITDTSSNVKMHLVPCKLLQSIPAILDGNGIARQAGECGMWDKVSNRFYGNVANRGSFTVSN